MSLMKMFLAALALATALFAAPTGLLAQTPPAATAAPAAPAPAPAATPSAPAEAKVIKIGSVVQLQSGGPKMTVVALGATASVQWYVESAAAFKKEEFPLAALKLADSDEDEEDEDDEDEDDED